jgi:hypothetical protein
LLYKLSVLLLAVSLALFSAVDFKAMDDRWLQDTTKSVFLCAGLLRFVTPLQSLSALFIADIGRYVGHTPAELQEIRSAPLSRLNCAEARSSNLAQLSR